MANRNIVTYEDVAPVYRARKAERSRRRRRKRLLRRVLLGLAGLLVVVSAALVLLPALFSAEAAGLPGVQPAAGQDPAQAAPAAAGAIVVAIDPGHGGYNENIGTVDTGCSGGGYTEPDLTYPTAQALAARLTADGRFAPVLTTDGSTYLKGSERAAAANEAGAALLLSIHCNADPYYDSSGFECYPSTPALPYNADALRFAALVADGWQQNGAVMRGENGIRYLYFHGADDERLVFESSDTTVHTDPTFGVVQYAECPALLVEQFFLTSSGDVQRFGGDEGCQRAAGIYYKAICDYFGLEAR